MARSQTIVQLTEELVAELDAEASRRGISRSALIRDALESYLAVRRDDAVVSRIVAGYRRVPPAEPDAWGDMRAQTGRASWETLVRLDEEERTGGPRPW